MDQVTLIKKEKNRQFAQQNVKGGTLRKPIDSVIKPRKFFVVVVEITLAN